MKFYTKSLLRFLSISAGLLLFSNAGISEELRDQLLGTWRTGNVGLEVPMAIEMTFHKDGKKTGAIVTGKNAASVPSALSPEEWELEGSVLRIGKRDASGKLVESQATRNIVIEGDTLKVLYNDTVRDVWTRIKK